MHLPDGFLSIQVATTAIATSAGGIAYASRRAQRELGEAQVPLMGVAGAFIFAAQMINFQVAGGTSGHLLGGALAAILLGPWAGALVMTAVLIVQALLFQDGGLLALGANVVNMAFVGVLSAYIVLRVGRGVLGKGRAAQLISAAIAAWTSVVLSALVCAAELALSGAIELGVALTAMGTVHAAIGLGEGVITAAVVAFLLGVRPDLLQVRPARA